MKKLEIKRISPASTFKSVLYLMIIPSALCLLMGIILAVIGAVTGETSLLIAGIVMTVLYPALLLALYGAICALMALVYNLFAKRFGGLEIDVDETDLSELQS